MRIIPELLYPFMIFSGGSGQVNITITQRYTHSNQELKRRAVELLAEKTNCRHKNKEDLLHIRYTEKPDSLNERLGKTVIPSFSDN